MGIVVQFKPKQIPAVLPSCKPSTNAQRGDGPALDSGALGAFLDRCAKKRNALSRFRTSLSSTILYPLNAAGSQGTKRSPPTHRRAMRTTMPAVGTGLFDFDVPSIL